MTEASTRHPGQTSVAVGSISRVLKIGSYGSTGLILAGLLLALVGRPAEAVHYDLLGMLRGLIRLDATAVMQAGIALLLLTPVGRIMAAVLAFAHERDYRYTWISMGVLLIVLSSILFR